MKLRHKFNLLIFSLIILPSTITAIIFYHYSREMLKEQVDSYLQMELTKNVYGIQGWLDTQSQIVVVIGDIIQKSYEKQDITKYLLQAYMSNENISDIYIGFTNGDFISGRGWAPDKGYDPRVRPWYKEAMAARELTISSIYFDYSHKQYAVAIALPLRDKHNELIGVISEDILLDTFYEQILNIQLKDSGYSYLLDLDGNILAHNDKNLIGKNFNQLVNEADQIDFKNSRTGKASYTYKGIQKIANYRHLDGTNWILVLVADENTVYSPLFTLLMICCTVVICAIFIAGVAFSLNNQKIIKRLKILSDASILISKGNFDTEFDCNKNDEIGDVSKAFQRMQIEIHDTISELNASRTKYEELIENTADAIYSIDIDGQLITANQVFLNMFHIEKDLIGKALFTSLVQNTELGSILILLGKEVMAENKLVYHQIDNIDEHYYSVTISPILDKNSEAIKGITGIIHDTSDLEISRSNLEWISHHDTLTKLPNRFKLMEDMETAILKAKTNDKSFAVLFIDLDDFKNINDTLGYSAGDYVLIRVANILQERYKTYRIGADEFALVMEDYLSPSELVEKIEELSDLLNHDFEYELNTVLHSATMGVVIYPYDFVNLNEMMIRGDAALNYGKKNKRADVQFYDYAISETLEEKVHIEKGLRKALENKEFILYYQPIIDGESETIKGFEALIRWQKKDGAIISPCQFMPIIENMAMIHEIGFWVIEQALYDLKHFHVISKNDYTMAINLSANQIKSLDFSDRAIEIIKRSGVNPKLIEFEITESVLIESLDLMKIQFEKLMQMGVKISLDDFGTGYSSLNYIQHFPFDILKIDKSFTDYIKQDNTTKSLIEYIIDIAHGMNMEIIAEGVENDLQKKYLTDKKCDYLQGYLFSRPVSSKDIEQLIL